MKRFPGPDHRLPALDGVRAIAVLLVVVFHAGALPFGGVGVNIFFALSGYLITGILLQARATGATTGAILMPFYIRRALRIFPLALLVAAIVGIVSRAGWPTLWYVSYIQNWLPNPGPPRALGHYWSLAVEEQFYLVWPIVALLLPVRRLALAAASVLVLDLAFRAALMHWDPPFATAHFVGNATLARADPIAVGALLAIGSAHGGLDRFRRLALPAVLAGGIVLGVVLHWQRTGSHVSRAYIVEESAIALIIGGCLLQILLDPPRWLQWRWLRWIGTISYGIYVIHGVLLPWCTAHIAAVPARLAVMLSVSVLVAALSWRYFEAPILRYKRRWPMPRPAVPA